MKTFEQKTMLPEFPKARRKMLELWNEALFAGMHGSDPFLAQIPVRTQREGDAAFISCSEMDYKMISVNFSFKARDAEGMTIEEFIGGAAKLGAEIAKEQVKGVFQEMMQPTPHTMPANFERPLTFRQIRDVWAKMEVRFDANGTPHWPAILAAPEVVAELNEKLPQWLEDAECRKQWAELMEIKRKEFDEREARRRLVD